MRALKKNKQKMFYSLYNDKTPIYETDENGDIVYTTIGTSRIPIEIGTQPSYNTPVEFHANISPNKGDSEIKAFGTFLDYTNVICIGGNTPIKETARIWKDTTPTYNQDGTVNIDSADYVVEKVAESLNSTLIAVKNIAKNG